MKYLFVTFKGRVVAKGIGGGIKHKYHWINWIRDGPTEGPPQEEKVIQASCFRQTVNFLKHFLKINSI